MDVEGAEIDFVEFKSGRWSNALTGVGGLLLLVCLLYLSLFTNEEDFLGTRIWRGGGLIKGIEEAIGWEAFVVLILLFAGWVAVYSVVSIWKAVDSTPDVAAFPEHLSFHPAVRRSPAGYEDISHWSIEIVSGHPVVWIHFEEPYWSLQGLFKRRTVKLEGGKEELAPLVGYFASHEIMQEKFVS